MNFERIRKIIGVLIMIVGSYFMILAFNLSGSFENEEYAKYIGILSLTFIFVGANLIRNKNFRKIIYTKKASLLKNENEDKIKECNIKIWRYKRENSKAKNAIKKVIIVIILILFLVYITIKMPQASKDESLLQVIGIIILSLRILVILKNVYLYIQNYKVNYVLDAMGKLYIFCTPSKKDEYESLSEEDLIDKKLIYQYGKEIINVKRILEGRGDYLINCTILNEDKTLKEKRILVLKDLENSYSLIEELKKLGEKK